MRQREDRNAWYLVIEIFWHGFISASTAFYGAYALRLGATNREIGLLSSIPALIILLISIPSGNFFQQRSKRFPWIVGSLFVYRVGLLLFAVIPWVHIPGISQGLLVVLLVSLLNIPANFCSMGFMPMLADVVSERLRANVIAFRNIIINAAVVLGVFFYGLWLDKIKFPLNYQLMFIFTSLISQVSTWILLKMEVPDSPPPKPKIRSKMLIPHSRKEIWLALKSALNSQPQFIHLLILVFALNVGLWMISPLSILYLVRILGATDGMIGINATISTVGTLIGLTFFRWLINRKGNVPILKAVSPSYGISSILFSFIPAMPLVYILTAFSSLINPGWSLSVTNLMLKTLPVDRRPSFYGLWTTITTFGSFIFPMIGVALTDHFGIPVIIRCGGILALAASVLIWVWQPREDSPRPADLSQD